MKFPPFRRSQRPEIQETPGALDLVSAKGGLYKVDNFWAFVKFPPFRRSQRPEISPPIELEISAPAACIFHHATCRHFQRCEPTDITGRNLPMMPIPLSLDAHQCALVACAWRVENAKRRQRVDRLVADTTAKQLRYLPALFGVVQLRCIYCLMSVKVSRESPWRLIGWWVALWF